MSEVMTIKPLNAWSKEMPEARIAVSSEDSPRFPKVISEDRSIAKGKAWGTSISPIYQKNCARISIVRPFPMRSSMYLHRNCIISTNWQMKNVPKKRSPNWRIMNISSFLIRGIIEFRRIICFVLKLKPVGLFQSLNDLCFLSRTEDNISLQK